MPRLPTLGPFARNLFAYGASEAAAKASRLFVVLAVSRTMGAAEIGLAAAAMAAGDLLKALTENGVGQRIVAAADADLAATCRAAHRIFWGWCLGLFALQAAVAGAVVLWSGNTLLGGLILLLAAEYLFMPGGLVQAALAMRAGKLRQTAAIAGAQVVGANAMTAALVLAWATPLALILPRVLSAPIWLVAMRRLHPWRPDRRVAPLPARAFARFGAGVLGVEVVKALRLQVDKLVIGWLLGAEALGIYFMAFNAGLGLANSFTVAFAKVLFPHICMATDRMQALRQAVVTSLRMFIPAILVQALFAPVYVPILFGARWAEISGLVSILCLAAIPNLVWSSAAGLMRAEGRSGHEFLVTLGLTLALALNSLVLARYGLDRVAVGYLVVVTIVQLAAAWPVLSGAFGPTLRKA